MRNRLASTLGLWTLIAGLLYFLGVPGALLIILLATGFTLLEFYQMLERMGYKPYRLSGMLCGLAIPLGSYIFGSPRLGTPDLEAGTMMLLLAVLIQSLIAVASPRNLSERVKRFLPTLSGILCIPFMMHFFVRIILQSESQGYPESTAIMLCVWVVAVTKFSDVGALLVGMVAGRNKLAPTISPKKTWEGAVGGVLFSALVGLGLLLAANAINPGIWPPAFNAWMAFFFSLPIAATAVASDLLESAFKREAALKDSGNAIPGIGGIFDVTDSVILAAPVAYLLFKISIF